jgi:hypothetical protein
VLVVDVPALGQHILHNVQRVSIHHGIVPRDTLAPIPENIILEQLDH